MFESFKRYRELKKNTKLIEDEKFLVDEEGRGIIEIGAENYEDIFSYYSLNGSNVLDGEFNKFLEAKADSIPLKYDLTLNFHVKDPDISKEQEIKFCVKENYEREIHAINRKMHNNTTFAFYMLLMGAIWLVAYILLFVFDIHFVLTVIAEIGTWVFFWETVDSFFLERRHLKQERLKKYRLMKSKIIISEFKLRTFDNTEQKTKKPPVKKSPSAKNKKNNMG